MSEKPKFELPAIVTERLRAGQQPAEHPAADLLAAFVEKSLGRPEREQILEHLGRCERCREVLALIAPAEGPPRLAPAAVVEHAGFNWRTLRWSALTAALALAAALTILKLQPEQKQQLARVQQAPAAPSAAKDQPLQEQAATIAKETIPARADFKKAPESLVAENKMDLALKAKTASEAKNEIASRDQEAKISAAPAAPPLMASNQAADVMTATNRRAAAGTDPEMAAPAPQSNADKRLAYTARAMSAVQQWRIRDGHLERSTDGANWNPVTVAPGVTFTAVFSLSNDTWAAGDNLTIYHSSGNPGQWSEGQIKETFDGLQNRAITSIRFSDPQHGQAFVGGIANATGKQVEIPLISNDGGKTWTIAALD
jgi:hypothetical protein